MRQDDLSKISTRATIFHMIITVIFVLGVVLFFAALFAIIFFLFASPDKFTAIKGNMNWSINYAVNNNSEFFIVIPFKIIQPLDSSMFSAKHALITYLFSFLISFALILYGIKQVANILKSTIKDATPFNIDNAKSLKRLAYSIIIYSAATGILATFLCAVFVTGIYAFDLTSIHLSGVIIGGIILLIADIFRYGVFLQNEFDTTL